MFDLGDTVPLGVTIRNASDVATTPSGIALTITLPNGTTVTPTPTLASTGVYTYDYVTTVAGRHSVRWTSTGPATAYTDAFDVDESTPAMLFSLEEAKEFLNVRDSTNDEEIREMIAAVTRVVEDKVGPCVRRTVTTLLYPNTYGEIVLPYTNVLSLTSAAYQDSGTSVDITSWTMDGGIIRTTTGYRPGAPITPWSITYVVGRAIIPPNVILAAKEILKLAWSSQRGQDVPAFLIPYRAEALLQPDLEFTGIA